MSKNDQNEIEDIDPEASDENLAAAADVEDTVEDFTDENIPEDKPERKKVAALRARHKLEDYFELKRIKDALEYLEEEAASKAALKAAKESAKEKSSQKIKEKSKEKVIKNKLQK